MTTFYNEMITLKHEILGIREDLDDKRLRTLAFEYPDGNSNYLIIVPKPIVSSPPKRLIGLQLDPKSNFTVAADDFYINCIPRSVPRQVFNRKAWLDVIVNINGTLSGIPCRCHYVDDKTSSLSYYLILRKELEKKNLN